MKKIQKKSKTEQGAEAIRDERPTYDVQRASRQPLWTLQGKFAVSEPGDKYEREADRVAEQVMRSPETGTTINAGKSLKLLRNKDSDGTPTTDGNAGHQIDSLKRSDQPLLPAMGSFFESRFGSDFNGVRMHTDAEAGDLKRKPNSKAATYKSDVYLGECAECRHHRQTNVSAHVQPQLTVNAPGDRYEAVMHTPVSNPVHSGPMGSIQRAADAGSTPATGETAQQIVALRGGDTPLSPSARTFFEPRFDRDFGDVRVHTDARAAEMAQSVNARAFTHGRDVVFGAGQYAPETSAGKRLLAHELAHVVQQGDGAKQAVQRQVAMIAEGAETVNTDEIVSKYVKWANYRGLAKHVLNNYLLKNRPKIAMQVLQSDKLNESIRELIFFNIFDIANNKHFQHIAKSDVGREFLRMGIKYLVKGHGGGFGPIPPEAEPSKKAIKQAMKAITDNEPIAGGGGQSDRMEVKVVTFESGLTDTLIPGIAGVQNFGHTALIVGGYVYSFEWEWQCGQTEEEYRKDNTHRSAIVHVLKINEDDAKIIQDALDEACATGNWSTSYTCTTASGELLRKSLSELDRTKYPKTLRNQLEQLDAFRRKYNWPKRGDGAAGASGASGAAVQPIGL